MKTKILNKRLLKLENVSKSSKAYQVIKELTGEYKIKSYMLSGNIIRPCYTQGSGRHTSVADHTILICMLLEKLNIKYITGNDAPRCGQCGKYIKILTKLD